MKNNLKAIIYAGTTKDKNGYPTPLYVYLIHEHEMQIPQQMRLAVIMPISELSPMPDRECYVESGGSEGSATALAVEALDAQPSLRNLRRAERDFASFLVENYKKPAFPFLQAASEIAGSLSPVAPEKRFPTAG